jgi:SAM-dependent methyltransferase
MMEDGTHLDYVGDELAIFALATNWKAYLARALAPYISGSVAEVGAGLSSNTRMMCNPARSEDWLCLEPDPGMATELKRMQTLGRLPERCIVHCGILTDIPRSQRFDTIVYIDVLEHIEDDRRELSEAATHLNERGRIVVLSPAWQHLYTAFDRKIGHFRRYTKSGLGISVADLEVEAAFYLDSAGYFASLMNKLLLRQSMPKRSQILTWDRFIIPVSRVLDRIICRRFGRSVVVVWRNIHGK